MNLEIRHIINRDQKAFQRLFELLYPGLVEYSYRFLYDRAASEDLVQEVFVDLWENAASYDIHSTLKGYLYSTVRNRCLNQLKSLKITDRDAILDISASLCSPDSIELIEQQEKEAMTRKAEIILESLPQKMRKIFSLKVIEGYSYAEIAEEMDVTVNTVKTQLKRARLKITQLNELLVLFFSMM